VSLARGPWLGGSPIRHWFVRRDIWLSVALLNVCVQGSWSEIVAKAQNNNPTLGRRSRSGIGHRRCAVCGQYLRLASHPLGLRTLTVLIPRSYNANGLGARVPVEQAKLFQTASEIKQYFSGYICKSVAGWQKDNRNPRGCNDSHWLFEIDTALSPELIEFLQNWKRRLQMRFRQRQIFMRLSSQVIWL